MASKTLALFDFDGTLTTKDTLIEFFRFREGSIKLYTGFVLLSPVLVAMKLKLLPNWKAKEWFLSYFLKGADLEEFEQQCKRFALEKMPDLLREEALRTFNYHINEGHDVMIVSASPENWVSKWSSYNKVRVLSTQLEVRDGKMTGKLNGFNCYGPEKVRRIKAAIDVNSYQSIHAYGDSRGDKEMLDLATRPFYKKFPF